MRELPVNVRFRGYSGHRPMSDFGCEAHQTEHRELARKVLFAGKWLRLERLAQVTLIGTKSLPGRVAHVAAVPIAGPVLRTSHTRLPQSSARGPLPGFRPAQTHL